MIYLFLANEDLSLYRERSEHLSLYRERSEHLSLYRERSEQFLFCCKNKGKYYTITTHLIYSFKKWI
jgi:hypothetical protein